MFGNIWLSSIVLISLITTASISYKSYQDIQDAKAIKESFDLILELKNKIATQYNISLENVTRDDIIAFLPKGENWEKVLVLNKYSSTNQYLINENADFEINEDDKIRVLALKAKLKELINSSALSKVNNTYTFKVYENKENFEFKNKQINNSINKVIELLYMKTTISKDEFNELVKKNIIYEYIYHNVKVHIDEKLSQEEIMLRKEQFFKKRLLKELENSQSFRDIKIYNKIKGFI